MIEQSTEREKRAVVVVVVVKRKMREIRSKMLFTAQTNEEKRETEKKK